MCSLELIYLTIFEKRMIASFKNFIQKTLIEHPYCKALFQALRVKQQDKIYLQSWYILGYWKEEVYRQSTNICICTYNVNNAMKKVKRINNTEAGDFLLDLLSIFYCGKIT